MTVDVGTGMGGGPFREEIPVAEFLEKAAQGDDLRELKPALKNPIDEVSALSDHVLNLDSDW